MKDQYVADIGDYGKYSLLRALAKEGVRVGVNWYYTSNDKGTDGKFKEYLDNEERFGNYCKEVFTILRSIPKEKRTVKTIEESGIILNALYYRDIVEFEGTPADRYNKRIEWSNKGRSKLSAADLIYFDPDNGLLTKEKLERRKNAAKYAFPAEVEAYYEEGKNVVYYCHKGRRKDSAWEEYKAFMLQRLSDAKPLVLTYHKGTQRSYVFLIHPKYYKKYESILLNFMETWRDAFSLEPIKEPITEDMHSFDL